MSHKSQGFTLVELMVVILIVVLLVAMLLPALNAAMSAAQSAKCANNLRQLGLGLNQYAVQSGYLSSGHFDWNRDGNITKSGWVADVLNGGFANPGAMLCPTSPCKMSEKWNDICDASTVTTTKGDGEIQYLNNDTPAKLTLDEARFAYQKGYNTNYVATWYLGRTAMLPLYADTDGVAKSGYNAKGLSTCVGPLSMPRLNSVSFTTADQIPLLGDGNYGDFAEATMSYDLPGCFKKGDIGCESYSDGPLRLASGVTTMYGATFSQDYVDFAPWHGSGGNKWANMLFADFHVSALFDKNKDTIVGYVGSGPSGKSDMTELKGVFDGNLLGPIVRSGKT